MSDCQRNDLQHTNPSTVLDSSTEEVADDDPSVSSSDETGRRGKKRNLRVAIPDKPFPLPITRLQTTPSSVPTPSQAPSIQPKQEPLNISTPSGFYYPIPLTPSMPSQINLLEPTMGLSTPASAGFAPSWNGWMTSSKPSTFLVKSLGMRAF